MLAPGARIGILGGGQLGRMTALAAASLGYRTHIFTPETDSPAGAVTPWTTVAPWTDEAALARFAEAVDVVTLEFENIPLAAAEAAARRRPMHPSPRVLATTQDRIVEKSFLAANGVATAWWRPVRSAAELADALRELGGRGILKTARLGYDGKGQATAAPGDEAQDLWSAMRGADCVLEGFVDFERELSVVLARGADGEVRTYPAVENRHRKHILDTTLAPAPIPGAVAEEAVRLAEHIAGALDIVGVLAVEMFLTRSGEILVNELAPRPHNSGHWTIDACVTSQFEQLVRAVCSLPLGSTERHADAVMTNLLGTDVETWPRWAAEPGAKLHLYGKTEARPGRKMGHVTRLRPRSAP